MRDSLRTFVAIDVPGEVKLLASQLIDRLRPTAANVRWASPEQMHWTLKFLGEVSLNDVPEICASVRAAVAAFEPFDVEAFGAGAFPEPDQPRTLWLGVRDGGEALIALHAAVEGKLAKLGFRAEQRRFRPHITLGRVRRSEAGLRELGDLIRQNAEFDAGVSCVFEVTIFSSELGPRGPKYEPLGHAELGR
jgi:RNA 2',3'-cyclic 3'-phosphodiesterase